MSAILDSLLDPERRATCARNDAAVAAGRRIVPYSTTKVQIGIAWQPSPARVEGDAITLQRALLAPATRRPASGLQRIVDFLWGLA